MSSWFFFTIVAIPASHAFDASFSVDLALQVVNPLSLIIAISIFLICKKINSSFTYFSNLWSKVWNCWRINEMINNKTSGYGWGNGIISGEIMINSRERGFGRI